MQRKPMILLHAAIVFSAGAGLFLNVRELNAPAHTLLYFTAQSNFWLMGVSGVLLWYQSLGRAVPLFWRRVQQVFTVCILLTGVGYNLILAPQYARRFGCLRRAYSPSVLLLHVVTPVLGLIGYLVQEEKTEQKEKDWLCLAPPLCYCAWAMLSPQLRKQPRQFDGIDGNPCLFPYFFMDYKRNGWFTKSKNPQQLGVAWWLILLSALTLLMGKLLRRAKQCHR